MDRTLYTILALSLSSVSFAQRAMSGYEYWFDNDRDNCCTVHTTDTLIHFEADVNELRPGAHVLCFRPFADDGTFGMVSSTVFIKGISDESNPSSMKCEYWFDTDYAQRKASVPADGSVIDLYADVSSLRVGMHTLCYRIIDGEGYAGQIYTHNFVRVASDGTDSRNLEYEYWFDTDYTNAVHGTQEGMTLDFDVPVNALRQGAHILNLHYRTPDGNYSPAVTKLFITERDVPQASDVVACRVWYDGKDTEADTISLDSANPLTLEDRLFDVPQVAFPKHLPEGVTLRRVAHEGIIDPDEIYNLRLRLSVESERTFHFSFMSADSVWSAEESAPFTHENATYVTAKPLPTNRVRSVSAPVGEGLSAQYVDMPDVGTLCLRADRDCLLTVFDDEGRVADTSAGELLSGVRIALPRGGRYYLVFHSDEVQPEGDSEQMKLVCVTDPLPSPLYIESAGTLSDLLSFSDESGIDSLSLTGSVNGVDFGKMNMLPSLERLNLSGARIVAGNGPEEKSDTLSARIFADMAALREVSLPSTLRYAEDGAFSGTGGQLLVIDWNSSVAPVRAESFDTPSVMGNLLVYASSGTACTYGGNVVIGGHAEDVRFTDRMPLRCPQPFRAASVSYSRDFGKMTVPHVSCGWEGLTLPFNVETVVSEERGLLAPFNSGDAGSRPFWLAELTGEGFHPSTSIRVNRPYIIAMPNSDEYEEEFNIRGRVTFSASDAEEGVTVESTVSLLSAPGPEFDLVPVYEAALRSDTVYAINDENYGDMLPGAAFIGGLRDVLPFEVYARSAVSVVSRPLYYNIGGTVVADGIDRLYRRTFGDMEIYSRDGVLYVDSPCRRTLGLYSADGRLVRLMRLSAGLNREYGLEPGVYFIGRTKVLIR